MSLAELRAGNQKSICSFTEKIVGERDAREKEMRRIEHFSRVFNLPLVLRFIFGGFLAGLATPGW